MGWLPIAIAAGAGLLFVVVWMLFNNPSPGSSRASLDARTRAWGARRLARPRRGTHLGWMASSVMLLLVLVLAALSSR